MPGHGRGTDAQLFVDAVDQPVIVAAHGTPAFVVFDVLALQPMVAEAGPHTIVQAPITAQAQGKSGSRHATPADAGARVLGAGVRQQRVIHRPPRTGQRPADAVGLAIEGDAAQQILYLEAHGRSADVGADAIALPACSEGDTISGFLAAWATRASHTFPAK
ncbi:hypothetical protein D3C76_1250920 [compost metagenome]